MPLQFSENIVLRTPLLPMNGDAKTHSLFLEGLFLSSPVMKQTMQKWKEGQLNQKDHEKFEQSLLKFESRAKNRCTPFGLFAGTSSIEWGTETNIQLLDSVDIAARIDMNVLCKMIQKTILLPEVYEQLLFYPNNTLYQIGEDYRYVETQELKTVQRIHKLNAVEASEYLSHILKFAENGRLFSELCSELVTDDITFEEAREFISELIDSQLLISELEPNVTGDEYLSVAINCLNKLDLTGPNSKLSHHLTAYVSIQELLTQYNQIVPVSELISAILHEIRKILPETEIKNSIHLDLFKQIHTGTVNVEIQEVLSDTLHFLKDILPSNKESDLEKFKKRFIERYENQEVSLNEVMGVNGIGYIEADNHQENILFKNIQLRPPQSTQKIDWNSYHQKCAEILIDAKEKNKKVIDLSEYQWEKMGGKQLPVSFNAIIKLVQKAQKKIYLSSAGGNTANSLNARFAYHDKVIRNDFESTHSFEQEKYGSRILAEVVHLPEDRVGNIMKRPNTRKYEIPYLAQSSKPKTEQINPDDLMIRVINNRIVLRSKRLNKEIIPRISNAHNFKTFNLPLYHFLGDLQSQDQDKTFLFFDWGNTKEAHEWLPRAEYKGVILCRASWKIHWENIQEFSPEDSFYEELALPQKVLFADGDNELVLDLATKEGRKLFLHEIQKRKKAWVFEHLFESTDTVVTDSNQKSFTNELVLSVLNSDFESPPEIKVSDATESRDVKRVFPLGSEWLYYKIYCDLGLSDDLLSFHLFPVLQQLQSEMKIDHWFFIRYGDPQPHLRVRLHIQDITKLGDVIIIMAELTEKLMNLKLISSMVSDTYIREIERYGKNTMILSEKIFAQDAMACALLLQQEELLPDEKWLYATTSIDSFLSDLDYSYQQKKDILEPMANAFFQEHGGDKDLRLQLNTKYRDLRPKLEAFLNDNSANEMISHRILALRKNNLKPLLDQVLEIKKSGGELDEFRFISGHIHMTINRIFSSRQRICEMVIYHTLVKHYSSVIARQNKNS